MFNRIFTVVFVAVTVAICCIQPSKAQVITDGLVSYWTLDAADIEGDTVKDVWGANHGVMEGKVKVVEGKINQGLEFDGSTSFVDCGGDESLDLTDAVTIEIWMNPNTVGEGGPNAGPVCKADAAVSPWNWQLRYNSPGGFMGFQFNAGGSKWISVQQKLEPEQWYHITGTYDGVDAICYLDTVETERISMPPIASGAGNFYIGQDGWVNVFDGVVDEVRIYNRALSESEIQNNYTTTSQLAVEPANGLAIAWGRIKVRN